jgi:glycosyltransferase involved in cell wall biosynthesis
VEPGKQLLLADKPEEFASAVELLLQNVALRERLIGAGRAYVEQHHDWADSVRALSESYNKAIADFSALSHATAKCLPSPTNAADSKAS